MIFYFIRHADPIYVPNSLTPLGERQAEAVAKRLALYGLDKIYSSPSARAVMTSRPTCEILKKEAELLGFTDEALAWKGLTVKNEEGNTRWMFHDPKHRRLLTDPSMTALGQRWFDHPDIKDYGFETEITRIYDETDKLFASLGFEHDRYTGRYKVTEAPYERVALFAHQGFGLAFLSCITDIPYPMFCTRFDTTHTGVTVIEFKDEGGYAIPKICTLSNDSHIYREGLPTVYNNLIRF